MKIIAQNRKAYFNYTIEEDIEAGLVLIGSEVKSLRDGRVNINDAYVAETDEGLFLVNLIIGSYKGAAIFTHDEKRPRKILLHKKETAKLIGKMRVKGYSLIPTKIFFNRRNKVKVMLGLAKGKKLYDKRETLKKRDEQRRSERGED